MRIGIATRRIAARIVFGCWLTLLLAGGCTDSRGRPEGARVTPGGSANGSLQLTLIASSLYQLLGARLGNGYQRAKSRHPFRDFVDATAHVDIGGKEISVRFQKRAHNPLLLAAGHDQTETRVPWLGNKRLRLILG